MKILALDFSSAQRSAAVWNDGNAAVSEAVDASPGREMKPFALIESALRQAGLEREAIGCLAVGIGRAGRRARDVLIQLAGREIVSARFAEADVEALVDRGVARVRLKVDESGELEIVVR